MSTSINEVLNSDIVFICVPTNSLPNGDCDISIVKDCVYNLVDLSYHGIIAIKSTVSPGTTQSLIEQLKSEKICFVPEFLRERCAISDFTEQHDLCVVGTNCPMTFDVVREAHGVYPKTVVQCSPTEAELCKYFVNAYNATLITFANSFYELCQKFGCDYSAVKTACVHKKHIYDMYLDCNEQFRAFAGVCLPKDLKCIAHIMKDTSVKFFEHLLKENANYSSTVPSGMRMSGEIS